MCPSLVRYNVRKEIFPRVKGTFSLGKLSFLFLSKIIKIASDVHYKDVIFLNQELSRITTVVGGQITK